MSRIGRILGIGLLAVASAAAEHYMFRHFGADDGVNTAVARLLQDRTGFLWAGTGNGLYRYDGLRFLRFGVDEGLPSSSIRGLHESADGTLWVLTGRGLARRGRGGFEAVKTGDSREESDLSGLDSSPDGEMYLGSKAGLLAGRIRSDSWAPEFHLVAKAPKAPVSGVFVETAGVIWFGCGLDLCLLDRGQLRVFGQADGLPREYWSAMLRDPRGNFWVRGPQHLYMRPAGAQKFVAMDRGLAQASNTCMSLTVDREGALLVSTDLGVARWMDGKWQIIGTAQGLESDTVTSVLQDREGSMWIGMWGAGLARWAGYGEWTSWTSADALPNNVVWGIRRHPSGSVWVGTDRGLLRMQSGSPSKVWTKKDGLAGDKVKALTIGPDGAVWSASLPGGITRTDPATGRMKVYGQKAGILDDRVIGLYFDEESRLWVSTSEGLFRSGPLGKDLRFERQLPPGTDERTMFFRFLEDRRGRLWMGSMRGLYLLENGQWTRLTTADGLKANAVSHVTEGGDGSIWVGYREPLGVSRLTFADGGIRAEHFNRNGALPSDYIVFLGVDARQRLWVGTDNGVAVRESGNWTIYRHEDGLVWNDCAANAFWPEPDGTVWIGTLKGLGRFRPGSHPQPVLPPPAVITAVQYGEHAADPGVGAEVSFRDRDFSVAFSGLSFLTERDIRFRYRLAGLDDRWVETEHRDARFANLPAGSYEFEVMARNQRSGWSTVPASLSFRVVPPWWQTWWFRVLAAGGLGALGAFLLRARVQQMMRERRRLEKAVRERTSELELQNSVVERQKREIEGLLRQAQEVSRLKSEFLANMSHEIRTPMNGVIGMTQLALTTALDEEQRDYIGTVRDSAEALLTVINDILDFSKIEAGRLELAHEPFSLRKCVNDALMVFAWKAQEKKMVLAQRVDRAVPDTLLGDAGRLRQILLNLIGNALKFADRGEIVVTVSLPHAGASAGSGCLVRFSVRDAGVGIPRDMQQMIFEAFAQADGSPRRRQGGTGLGLAICSSLVRLMQGRIWVESAPGAGSTFFFEVPMAMAGEESQPPAATRDPIACGDAGADAGADAPLHILLAEDHAVNRKLAQKVLEKMGHAIVLVENGRDAVEAAGRTDFDVILMDLQMPEMDGVEATARIRQAERVTGRHTPIVALTAHAMKGDREQCLLAGMDGYIAKPIDFQVLAGVIRSVVSRQEASP